jgi:hypothetical protein
MTTEERRGEEKREKEERKGERIRGENSREDNVHIPPWCTCAVSLFPMKYSHSNHNNTTGLIIKTVIFTNNKNGK